MTTAGKLGLIAAGYGLSVAGGLAAVILNAAFIPAETMQASGGMVAFGEMILFVLVSGFFSLVPTWFLLKLGIAKAPRVLLAAVFLIAAMGPVSWLALVYPANDATPANLPHATNELLGLLIVFGAIPRIVFGPILLVIEGATFFLARQRITRALLAAATLMDIVPLALFALHMARAIL